MSYIDRSKFVSAMHVAASRDLYFSGGYLDRTKGQLKSWPWLHMHIKFGNLEGAVWANKTKSRFLLVSYDADVKSMRSMMELSISELSNFTSQDGVFWVLAEPVREIKSRKRV